MVTEAAGPRGTAERDGPRDRPPDRGHRHAAGRSRSTAAPCTSHVLLTIEGCPLQDRITQRRDGRRAAARRRRARRRPPDPDEPGAARSARRSSSAAGAPAAGGAAASRDQFPPQTVGDRDRLGQGRRRQVERHGEPRGRARRRGHAVGVLDADVWGFSVPRMMGVSGKPVGFNDMILPLEAHGVKVISMGFFVPEETPVIWRGPMLHKAIEQFLGDVYWGDLDFLLCDLPPGTGRRVASRSRRSCRAPRCSSSRPRRRPPARSPSAPARWPSARTCGRSA